MFVAAPRICLRTPPRHPVGNEVSVVVGCELSRGGVCQNRISLVSSIVCAINSLTFGRTSTTTTSGISYLLRENFRVCPEDFWVILPLLYFWHRCAIDVGDSGGDCGEGHFGGGGTCKSTVV